MFVQVAPICAYIAVSGVGERPCLGVKARGRGLDEVQGIGSLRCLVNLCLAGVGLAVQNVVPDGACEQVWLLADQ